MSENDKVFKNEMLFASKHVYKKITIYGGLSCANSCFSGKSFWNLDKMVLLHSYLWAGEGEAEDDF